MKDYPFVSETFIAAMNDIGKYGFEKYKDKSFQARLLGGGALVRDERTTTLANIHHARTHMAEYHTGIPHDRFHDPIHQLAAAAFNCMMEAEFAGLTKKEPK